MANAERTISTHKLKISHVSPSASTESKIIIYAWNWSILETLHPPWKKSYLPAICSIHTRRGKFYHPCRSFFLAATHHSSLFLCVYALNDPYSIYNTACPPSYLCNIGNNNLRSPRGRGGPRGMAYDHLRRFLFDCDQGRFFAVLIFVFCKILRHFYRILM